MNTYENHLQVKIHSWDDNTILDFAKEYGDSGQNFNAGKFGIDNSLKEAANVFVLTEIEVRNLRFKLRHA